ncbi:hypothetical protein [Neobacillus mesonae]|uniref:hypothetical protein n=1 Tax=Neobacillus mesonae TaxID=1193713 RepID=UPI00203D6DF6|nr:hypothetical protein [Neobacillus mesonae]MCM3567272.1 hypothetical protein [Neobacillus mesonae]
MLKMVFWAVVLFGSGYSFWYSYYLVKGKNKLGALGIALVGGLIFGLSFLVKVK